MSDLGDYIKKIRDRLRSVRDTAKDVGDDNTPTQEQQESVEEDLDAAAADLARIHDPNASPSLEPATAGEVQDPTIPSSREQTATDAVVWAEEAHEEASAIGSQPDYDYIGDRTRTIASVYIPEIRDDFSLT